VRAVGSSFESVGEETVRGAATHRYRSSVDLGRFAQLLAEDGRPDLPASTNSSPN
jgi:hypothetical protein